MVEQPNAEQGSFNAMINSPMVVPLAFITAYTIVLVLLNLPMILRDMQVRFKRSFQQRL